MKTADRVIFIVVDGLRPEAVQSDRMPALFNLAGRGAVSLGAQTVMPSITLPTHMTMFHSVAPEEHHVWGNTYLFNPELGPGIVEVVHQAKRAAAAFYTWEPLRDLWRPGSIKHSWFLNIYSSPSLDFDLEAARAAAEYTLREPPDFLFVYLGMVDELAHKRGWMSPGYFEAVEAADAAIALLLSQLDSGGLLGGSAVLVQADHGGHEHSHGTDLQEDMTIPWILSGCGVRKGVRMQKPVSILDTAPTIARLLGLDIPPEWKGRVVTEALE